MQDRGLSEFKSFSGCLQASGHSMPITFSARISRTGEVEFDFGTITRTQETIFIMTSWNGEGSKLRYFLLSGKSEDGTEFKTKYLHFKSLGHGWNEEAGSHMRLVGGCLQAKFYCRLQAAASKPIIRMHLKGFQNFHQLKAISCLGTVVMDGETSTDDPDTIMGYIAVQPDKQPADLSAWHTEADKLLEHIRRVMSFGSAAVLKSPIIEYIAGYEREVLVLSQSKQASASMRIIHYLNQQPMFEAAVKSFFDPPIKVKNLFFAIEWFTMEATYNEVRLVNAMTALENLVASNLVDGDSEIRPRTEFKKIRIKLRQVIKKCVEKWSAEEAEKSNEVVADLNEKLSDLNRRSILKKINTLSTLWSVPLNGISDDKLQAAKRARDCIVHRGHYYEEGKEDSDDLWEHVSVVREIVVRFLLTTIGYNGSYFSYLGGYHEAQFPPQANVPDAN